MIRTTLRIMSLAGLLLCSNAAAQLLVSPQRTSPKVAEPPPKTLAVHAMDHPDPLLRYRFWPAPEHRRDENPAPLISRAVMLSLQVPPDTRKEFAQRYDQWTDMAVDDLPKEEVRQMLDRYAMVLRELQRCENLMRIDYNIQLDQLSAPDVIQTLLPELQEMRQLGRLLSLRARLAIAEARWDDFVDDCRLGFRLAEIAGHSTDFLIGRLVGFAISGLTMATVEEAIQHPDCPNLYWALATLPADQLFETRQSLEYESILFARVFENAEPLPDHPIGAAAARERLRAVVREFNLLMSNSDDRAAHANASDMMTGFYVVTMAQPSRELLAETPEWGDRAKDLSVSEAVLRAFKLRFARTRDRWVAWSTLLPEEAWDEYEPERNAAFGFMASGTDVLETIIWNLTPAVDAARSAGRRTNQQRNLLATVEAIRMHAATTGELPETTEKLRPVPAWNDAITMQPLGYHRTSPTKATLTRAARWKKGDPETTIHIELKGVK